MNSSAKEVVDVPDSSSSHTSPDKSIEKKPIGERASLSAPATPWKEHECLYLFRNGHINERSLQVLERLSVLVNAIRTSDSVSLSMKKSLGL
jgi:hypothetical protein